MAMRPDVEIRSVRILIGLKRAYEAGYQNIRAAAKWSEVPEGTEAFGEIISRAQIAEALKEIELYRGLDLKTLFGRGDTEESTNTRRLYLPVDTDDITRKTIAWAESVIAAVLGNDGELQEACEIISISSENYICASILPNVISDYNDDRKGKKKALVRFELHELPSLDAAKEQHMRTETTLLIHSARPEKITKSGPHWATDENLTRLERKVDGIEISTAVQFPDMAFIPRNLWETSTHPDKKPLKSLKKNKLELADLMDYGVALVNYADSPLEIAIPGQATPRVKVDSMVAAIGLVQTGQYIGIMNSFGMRLFNSTEIVVRPIDTRRHPVYLQVYRRKHSVLSPAALEFIDAVYRWLFRNTPSPNPIES